MNDGTTAKANFTQAIRGVNGQPRCCWGFVGTTVCAIGRRGYDRPGVGARHFPISTWMHPGSASIPVYARRSGHGAAGFNESVLTKSSANQSDTARTFEFLRKTRRRSMPEFIRPLRTHSTSPDSHFVQQRVLTTNGGTLVYSGRFTMASVARHFILARLRLSAVLAIKRWSVPTPPNGKERYVLSRRQLTDSRKIRR